MNPTIGFIMVGFHSPDLSSNCTFMPGLFFEARSSCWSLLQFKQKQSNLAVSDWSTAVPQIRPRREKN